MIIRKLERDDLPTRVEWMNNPRVYKSMHFSVPILLENTYSWFEKNLGDFSRKDLVFCDLLGGQSLRLEA